MPVAAQRPLTLVEEWRVSGADHDLLPIGGVGSLFAVSATGYVAIGQRDDRMVVLVSPDGRLLGRYGRRGNGPGEISTLFQVGWVGDSLWVRTGPLGGGQRALMISRDGELQRTISLPSRVPASPRLPQRSIAPVVGAIRANGDVLMVVAHPAANTRSMASPPVARSVVLVRASGDLIDILGDQPSHDCFVRRPSGERFPLPYCQDPPYDIGADGESAVFTSWDKGKDVVTVSRIDSRRRTAFSSSLDLRPARIPRDLMDREVAALTGGQSNLKSLLPRSVLPERFAPVREVVAGQGGAVLLRLGTRADRHAWLVLDHVGRTVGTFQLPLTTRVRAGSTTAIWVTESDADDLEDIVKYRLQ